MSITPIIYTGETFKHLRETEPEISVYALVKATKISRQQINEFEAGERTIYLSTLTRLVTALTELKADKKGVEK